MFDLSRAGGSEAADVFGYADAWCAAAENNKRTYVFVVVNLSLQSMVLYFFSIVLLFDTFHEYLSQKPFSFYSTPTMEQGRRTPLSILRVLRVRSNQLAEAVNECFDPTRRSQHLSIRT